MRKIGMVAAALWLIVFSSFSWAEGPKLLAENFDFHFGQIFQGVRLDHTFRISNEGDSPLTIEKIRSSCGCTAALMSETTIPAGTSAELKVSFDSTRFSGPVVKTIYLYTNDPLNRVAQFYLRGKVVPELLLEPTAVNFGTLQAGVEAQKTVRITNSGKQMIHIIKAESDLQEVSVSAMSEGIPPGGSIDLRIIAKPVEGKAQAKGFVVVQTDSEYSPRVKIKVHLTVADSSSK